LGKDKGTIRGRREKQYGSLTGAGESTIEKRKRARGLERD